MQVLKDSIREKRVVLTLHEKKKSLGRGLLVMTLDEGWEGLRQFHLLQLSSVQGALTDVGFSFEHVSSMIKSMIKI